MHLLAGFDHVLEGAKPGGALTSTAMLPGRCWFFIIRICALGICSWGTLPTCTDDAALDDELTRSARLQQMSEVRACTRF
jgi:hypothetical protein